ncbi:MAG: hypothetical protein LW750_08440 [Bacteroidetes bacterium]|jgi:hypothetical protein|nr:hypothetical protein [Bacteroidota bacterium]
MKLTINDTTTISQAQEAFHEAFPFLKLEFFHGEVNAANRIASGDTLLSSVASRFTPGEMIIHSNEKVSTLERIMQERFGINAQVLRKSGKVWLVTSTTDDLSLSEQNKIAQEMNTKVPAAEPGDIHEQE